MEPCRHSRPGDTATQDRGCRWRRWEGAGHGPRGEAGRERGPHTPWAGPASGLVSRPCPVPRTLGHSLGDLRPGLSHVRAGVRCGVSLAKEAPPRVPSRAETKQDGPVTIAPSAYWGERRAWEAEAPTVPEEQEGRGLDTSTPNRKAGSSGRIICRGCRLFSQVARPQCENV